MKRNTQLAMLFCVLAAMAFVGCSGSKKAEQGSMTIRVAENVPNLITPGVWDGQAFALDSSIYDYLVEIDPDTRELTPALAVSWDSEDGKTWTLKLREGVKFHDGSDFDSADVKFTIERTQDPKIGHLKAQDFKVVDSIETPDPLTVVLRLKEVRPTFIYLFSDYNMAMLSSTYDYAAKGETEPMGTGAFVLNTLVPKESALLEKNPSYWNKGYPIADKLAIYFVPDIDSSVAMLEAGKVDVVPFVTPIIKKRLEEQDGKYRVVAPYQEHRFVALSADRKPFSDPKVRLAMKYSIDPEILAKACQGTLGKEVFYNETPIMNQLSQYADIPFRGRDIAKAKALLAEAGYPDGVSFEAYYASDHPFSADIAQAIKELAAPAGFDVILKGTPRDMYLTQHWMNGPMQITGWGARVDPSVLLMLAYQSKGPWNESHIADPEVDSLIEKIMVEPDAAARQALYAKLQRAFYERGTVLNVQVPYLVAMSADVENYKQPVTMLPQYKYVSLKRGK